MLKLRQSFAIIARPCLFALIMCSPLVYSPSFAEGGGSFFPPSPNSSGSSCDVPSVITWNGTGNTKCIPIKDFLGPAVAQMLANAGCKPGQRVTVSGNVLKCI